MLQELKLYARAEGAATWTQLDMRGGESINLSKKMLDVSRVDVIETESTKTINVPAETNAAFFKRWGEQGFNGFDATAFYEAKLVKDTETLIEGSFYLLGRDRKTNNYACMIANKTGSISARCGEKTLGDLAPALSAVYAHTKTAENIRDSFTDVPTGDWRDYVKYAPVDNAFGIGLYTDVRPIYPAGTDNELWDIRNANMPYPISKMRPVINMGKFLHLVFADLGLTTYVPGVNEFLRDESLELDPWLILNDDIKITGTGATTIETLPTFATAQDLAEGERLSSTVNKIAPVMVGAGGHEVNAVFEFDVRSRDTIQPDDVYVVEFTAEIIETDSAGNRIASLGSAVYGYAFDDGSGLVVIPFNFTASFQTLGDTYISVDISHASVGAVVVYITYETDSSDVTLNITSTAKTALGTVKMYDFIKYAILQFNLIPIFQPSGIVLKNLAALYNANPPVDWSSNIEYNDDFKINALTDFMPKALSFEYTKADGYLDNQVINELGKPAGSLGITIDRGTLVEKSELKIPYAPFLRTKVLGEYPLCHNFKDINKPSETEIKPMPVFLNPTLTVTQWYLGALPVTAWPDWDMSDGGFSLQFKHVEIPDNRVPIADLFQSQHALKFKEWFGLNYSSAIGVLIDNSQLIKRRLIECSAWLTYAEFSALTLGEIVNISNQYGTFQCRLLEVTGFDATKESSKCKVKLITRI